MFSAFLHSKRHHCFFSINGYFSKHPWICLLLWWVFPTNRPFCHGVGQCSFHCQSWGPWCCVRAILQALDATEVHWLLITGTCMVSSFTKTSITAWSSLNGGICIGWVSRDISEEAPKWFLPESLRAVSYRHHAFKWHSKPKQQVTICLKPLSCRSKPATSSPALPNTVESPAVRWSC